MNASSSTSASKEKGFTLLEILIAITLLAFVTLGIVSVTENAFQTMERTGEINENNMLSETAFNRFEWDFSQIYSPLFFSAPMSINPVAGNATNPQSTTNQQVAGQAGQQNGQVSAELAAYYEQLMNRFQSNEHFSGVSQEGLPIPKFYFADKFTFEFFTTSNRRKVQNIKQSNFAWVRYTLRPQEDSTDPGKIETPGEAAIPKNLRSLVRYFYADDPYNDKRIDPEDDLVKGAVLLKNVEDMEFQFWDLDRRKWETSLTNIRNGINVQRGVKMKLTWYDNQGVKRTAERIFRNPWPLAGPSDLTTTTTTTTTTTNGQTTNPNGQTNTNNQNNVGF
jgi:prepilin-type N-terminal cleavage/methylation domain-containing protein